MSGLISGNKLGSGKTVVDLIKVGGLATKETIFINPSPSSPEPPQPSEPPDYFTYTADSHGSVTPKWNTPGEPLQYSIDNGVTWSNATSDGPISGNKVLFRGKGRSGLNNAFAACQWGLNGSGATISGDIRTLLDYEDVDNVQLCDYAFCSVFYGSYLTNAENLKLPTDQLSDNCYQGMFQNAADLIKGPELPATQLANNCYDTMFAGCYRLISGPTILPALTLKIACYINMFHGCYALKTAPVLPAPVLVSQCYLQMFYGCSELDQIKCLAETIGIGAHTNQWVNNVAGAGTFYKKTGANWTGTLYANSGVPAGWVVEEVEEV